MPGVEALTERDVMIFEAGYPLERELKEGLVIDLLSVLGTTVYASDQVPFDAGVFGGQDVSLAVSQI